MTDKLYSYRYPHPAVTTDCVIFGFDGTKIQVLLIERGIAPFKGMWALPGGFIQMDESAEECARRELQEETGLDEAFMEQFHTFSTVGRDPRERVISIAYFALVRLREVQGGDDAANAKWFSLNELPELAFDHKDILDMGFEALKEQIHFQPIGFELLPEKFTMRELQTLYESILGVTFDRRNFAKKIFHYNLLINLDEKDANSKKRKASLYKFNIDSYNELKNRGFRLEF